MKKAVVALVLALLAAGIFAADMLLTLDGYPDCGAKLVPAEPPTANAGELRYKVLFRPDKPVKNIRVLLWGQKSTGLTGELAPEDFLIYGNRLTPSDDGNGNYSFYHSVYNTEWPGGIFYVFYDLDAGKMLGAVQVVRDLAQEPDPNLPYTGDDADRESILGTNPAMTQIESVPARETADQRGVAAAENLSAERISALAKEAQGGNAGGNIRGELQQREAWKKLLEEAVHFFNERPYFDVVYNTSPITGKIDYKTGKAELLYSMWLVPNAEFDILQIIIRAALEAGKIREWGLNDLYTDLLLSRSAGGGFRDYCFVVEAELLDNTGAFLANSSVELVARWDAGWPAGRRLTVLSRNKLQFTVSIGAITENLRLGFVRAGKKLLRPKLSSFEVTDTPNVINSIRILPTEKTFQQYFDDRDFRRKRVELFIPSYDAPSAIFPVTAK